MEKKEYYNFLYESQNYPESEKEYLYPLFEIILDNIKERIFKNSLMDIDKNARFVVNYLTQEHISDLSLLKPEFINEMKESEKYRSRLVLIVTDKIVFNEYLNYSPITLIDRYNPIISTPRFILNFILNRLSLIEEYKNFTCRIIYDALRKIFLLSNSIFELLEEGSETEAFSTWRTMHEMECVIKVLYEYQYLGDTYLLHMNYNNAFRDDIDDKEEQQRIIEEIKLKLKSHNLKVKDLKKYIEYGWMYSIKDQETLFPDFKLNFRKGLQYVAGFSMYSNLYEMSSEIAHSSPLLIYSKKEYFNDITILSVYGTFLRIEDIFYKLTKENTNIDMSSYDQMRSDYLEDMKRILIRERNKFNVKYPNKSSESMVEEEKKD